MGKERNDVFTHLVKLRKEEKNEMGCMFGRSCHPHTLGLKKPRNKTKGEGGKRQRQPPRGLRDYLPSHTTPPHPT